MAQDKFLDRAYGLKTVADTQQLYDQWSASYDREVDEHGYATPARIAAALAGVTDDPGAPVLDFGCGTGVSGAALAAAGFSTLDGADLSAEMLARARAKGIYRSLWQVAPQTGLDIAPGTYPTITAIGVIGVGAAPLSVFDTLMAALAPGGRLALSFNDHALADPAFEAKLASYTDPGAARMLVRDYGDHLPGIGLKSMIYVLEKT